MTIPKHAKRRGRCNKCEKRRAAIKLAAQKFLVRFKPKGKAHE